MFVSKIVSKILPKIVEPGTIYTQDDPEFYGQIPVRQEIVVISADEPKQLKLGWTVSELVGIGMVNLRKRRYRICA